MTSPSEYLPGIPIADANIHGYRPCRPCVICHRTYGGWGGDYAVIQSEGLAHLLIGKDEGQWVQFGPPNALFYHCNGANDGYGIEVTGTNEDDFTDWQIRCLRYVVPLLSSVIGVPQTYDDNAWVNGHTYVGFHSHNGVSTDDGTSQHTNIWKRSDWDKIVLPAAPAPVAAQHRDGEMIYIAEDDGFNVPKGSFFLVVPGVTCRRIGEGQSFEQILHNWGSLPACPVPGNYIWNEIINILQKEKRINDIAAKVGVTG